MTVPGVELVLLLLLVLFFGMQQRRRPQQYFRFWFVGWLLVMGSYVAARLQDQHPVWALQLEATRLDLILVGSLTFLMSFLAADERLWRTVRRGSLVGVPVAVLFNAELFWNVPRVVLVLGVLAWHVEGLREAALLVPKGVATAAVGGDCHLHRIVRCPGGDDCVGIAA